MIGSPVLNHWVEKVGMRRLGMETPLEAIEAIDPRVGNQAIQRGFSEEIRTGGVKFAPLHPDDMKTEKEDCLSVWPGSEPSFSLMWIE